MAEFSHPIWQEHTDRLGYDDPRVFIPLSNNGGCPVGCKYCYIPALGAEPIPIERNTFAELLSEATDDPRYKHGDTLVSFGCVDDPFYPTLTSNLITGLGHFANLERDYQPILQIASKLIVPEEIKEFAQSWPKSVHEPAVSVSITSIENAAKLEPNAPPPSERAANFTTLRDMGWFSIAMMKPYFPSMNREVENFVDLYSHSIPDAVVVGSRHARNSNRNNATSKPHPVAPDWSRIDKNDEAMNDFSSELRHALAERALGYIPVFESSVKATIHFLTR